MKKKLATLLALMMLLATLAVPAYAKEFKGDGSWNVTFTAGAEMVSNFQTNSFDDLIYGLQPGDSAIITVTLRNTHPEITNWYMTNKVLQSLEDNSQTADGRGGAYTYVLTYVDGDGEELILFSNDTVGGQTSNALNNQIGQGLNQATNALENFFYLDTLTQGQSGTVTLLVALEGETQGNDYQDTLAELQMNFAVELAPEGQTSTGRRTNVIVQTGDEYDMVPYLIAAFISGLLLLLFALFTIRQRKAQRRRGRQH